MFAFAAVGAWTVLSGLAPLVMRARRCRVGNSQRRADVGPHRLGSDCWLISSTLGIGRPPAATLTVPKGLRRKIMKIVDENPAVPWDKALEAVME